jgi:hypothetical protein
MLLLELISFTTTEFQRRHPLSKFIGARLARASLTPTVKTRGKGSEHIGGRLIFNKSPDLPGLFFRIYERRLEA